MIRSTKSPRVVGYVTSSEPDAKPYELAILTLWLTILFVPPFPGITILRYLIVFYFLSFIVLDAGRVFSAIKRSWIVLPLPILGVFSMFWSPYPTEALRTALLFLTSPVIVIIMATRFSPREIINCLVIASIIGTLYAALFLGTANTGGPYASKNFLAFHMLVAVIACVAIALDKRSRPTFACCCRHRFYRYCRLTSDYVSFAYDRLNPDACCHSLYVYWPQKY